MTTEHLKQSLKSLHASLSETGPLDPESQALLRTLDADIHQLLEKQNETPAFDGSDPSLTSGLALRSQELAAKFAARHPTLEPALRELSNILASMGI